MAEINVFKKCLPNTSMHIYRVRGGSDQKCFLLRMKIPNFHHFKYNTDYVEDIIILAGIYRVALNVKFTRKKRTVSVVIIIEGSSKLVVCYVDYDNGAISPPVYPEQFFKDEYQVDFHSNIVNDPKNMPLKEGYLWLAFKLKLGTELQRTLYPFAGLQMISEDDSTFGRFQKRSNNHRKSEEEVMSENLKIYFGNSFKESRFEDFIIYVETHEKGLHAHKALLAARSKFFCKYIKADYLSLAKEEITLFDTTHEAVTLMLEFLYCGKINGEEVGTMLEVLELSVKLEIASLERLCINFLKENVDVHSVTKIKAAAEKMGVETLMTTADCFLENINII